MVREVIIDIIYRFFWLFPMKKRIVFSNFNGKKYGGDPRAISDSLKGKYECVWLFENKKFFENDKITNVKMHSIRCIYYIATSKIWVDSHRIDNRLKRKGQIVIQTWHAPLPIKTIEGHDSLFFSEADRNGAKKSSEMTDYYLTHSNLATRIIKEGLFYDGKLLEYGFPSLDKLMDINERDVRKIKEQFCSDYNIDNDKKFVLYAPTYRENDSLLNGAISYKHLCTFLRKRFGNDWICLLRRHPLSDIFVEQAVIDVSGYKYVEELMLICDACITDYSSIITDYMLLDRPCFLYAFDYDNYNRTRGFSIEYSEFPFPISYNQDELYEAIEKYDIDY